nr:DUF1127 domain-containing protein [uncultured Dongia sp.]
MSSNVLPRRLRSTWLVLLSGVVRKIVDAHRRRRAVATLHQLPDHMLRDIGISRSQITRAVDTGHFN